MDKTDDNEEQEAEEVTGYLELVLVPPVTAYQTGAIRIEEAAVRCDSFLFILQSKPCPPCTG